MEDFRHCMEFCTHDSILDLNLGCRAPQNGIHTQKSGQNSPNMEAIYLWCIFPCENSEVMDDLGCNVEFIGDDVND